MNAPLMPPLRSIEPPLLLDENSNGLLMSPEEFAAITYDDCDPRFHYELLNGVVIVNPPPDDAGQGPNERLGQWLLNYHDFHPQGKSLDDTISERMIRTHVGFRIVDRAIWCGYGRPIRSKRDLPTIIVEFVSAGKRAWLRDYQQKRGEYLALGCKEYWVIDRFRRTMTAYYQPPANPPERVLAEDEIYTTPLLPGFELRLKRVFELADQYSDDEGA
jgi:Uma2 family endonuclease